MEITYRSTPTNRSINDDIRPQSSSLSYSIVDHLATIILHEHQGCYLIEADVKEAFRMLPILLEDQPLLGVYYCNTYYTSVLVYFGGQ